MLLHLDLAPAHEHRFSLLPQGENGGADEDRGVGARGDAHEQREREVLERLPAEEQQRADRHQGREAGRERAGQHLGHRAVHDLRVGRARHARHVLADAVEHDDRVVERVAQDREQSGDRRGGQLPAHEGIDAARDEDVVGRRDEHRHRELELEADAYVEREQEERCDDRDQRGARDLRAEGRPDRVRREVGAVHAEVVVERLPHLRHLPRLQGRGGDLEDVGARDRARRPSGSSRSRGRAARARRAPGPRRPCARPAS